MTTTYCTYYLGTYKLQLIHRYTLVCKLLQAAATQRRAVGHSASVADFRTDSWSWSVRAAPQLPLPFRSTSASKESLSPLTFTPYSSATSHALTLSAVFLPLCLPILSRQHHIAVAKILHCRWSVGQAGRSMVCAMMREW